MHGLWREDDRVLAIDPTNRGFGFAVLEGAARLIDWGIRDTRRADNARAVHHAESLLDHYAPDALVVEDTDHDSCRRSIRVRSLIKAINQVAEVRGIAVSRVPRSEVSEVFAPLGAPNKEGIWAVIVGHFQELAPRRPPHRKPWMSEDVRGSIFDAVSLALAHYFETAETSAATEHQELQK